jgi:hypothetical protein
MRDEETKDGMYRMVGGGMLVIESSGKVLEGVESLCLYMQARLLVLGRRFIFDR